MVALTKHGDAAFLQEQNLVRSRQGGGSMSDDDKGHPRLFELKDRLGERRLSGLVEIGVWFMRMMNCGLPNTARASPTR